MDMSPYFVCSSEWYEFITKILNIKLNPEEFKQVCPDIDKCEDCCGRCLELSHKVKICQEIHRWYVERREKPPALLEQVGADLDEYDENPLNK